MAERIPADSPEQKPVIDMGQYLFNGLEGFRRTIADSVTGIVMSDEHAVVLARFVRTSNYLANFPWCPEHPYGIGNYHGLAASFQGAFGYYPSGPYEQMETDIDTDLTEQLAVQELQIARVPLLFGAHEALMSDQNIEFFAYKLGIMGSSPSDMSTEELTPHIVHALDYYGTRRHFLESSDPW